MSELPREVERDDPLFAPFWEGTEAGEIRLPRCRGCVRYRWPPRSMCPTCQTIETDWAAIPSDGVLFSWIDVRHQTVPGVSPPYAVGLVELPGTGVRMLGQLVECQAQDLQIGMSLLARFDPSAAGVTLVNWRPRDKASALEHRQPPGRREAGGGGTGAGGG